MKEGRCEGGVRGEHVGDSKQIVVLAEKQEEGVEGVMDV